MMPSPTSPSLWSRFWMWFLRPFTASPDHRSGTVLPDGDDIGGPVLPPDACPDPISAKFRDEQRIQRYLDQIESDEYDP